MRWPMLLVAATGLVCLAEDGPAFHSVEQFEKTPFFRKADLALEQDWTSEDVSKRVVRYITADAKRAETSPEVRVTLRYVRRLGTFELSAYAITITTRGEAKLTPDQRLSLLKAFAELNRFPEPVAARLYRELEAAEKERSHDDVGTRFPELIKGVEANIQATPTFLYLGFSRY